MARVSAEKVQMTRAGLLSAANTVLREQGYAGLSTRGVAAEAGVPMSQIHYHFGSKEGMILALYERMNAQLLERQTALFDNSALSLTEQWDLACDYLDEDLASGYVHVLQELMAAGWTTPQIRKVVGEGLLSWQRLLTRLAAKAQTQYGSLGPFTPEDIAALVGAAFIGAEAFLLLGLEGEALPIRRALRRFGDVIRLLEKR